MFDTNQIQEHMEVIDAKGHHVGTVDSVDGEVIKLTRSDSDDGRHHFLPLNAAEEIKDGSLRLKEGTPIPQGTHRDAMA